MGLWRNDPETPEGKYPIVLRRDGTPLESRYIVLTLQDPCTAKALESYARALEKIVNNHTEGDYGWTKHDADSFIKDIRDLAAESKYISATNSSDPGAPRHRKDNQAILAWARSLDCPGA